MNISEDHRRQYREEGFGTFDSVVPDWAISRVRRVIYKLYRSLAPGDNGLAQFEFPWEEAEFDRRLIKLRQREPRTFSVLYDCAQGAVAFRNLVTLPEVVDVATGLLDASSDELSCSGYLLRMDPPEDTRNTLNWHQDRAYFPQNFDGNNGVVITVALQDTGAEMGAVKICPRSHESGFVVTGVHNAANAGDSEQRAIPSEIVDKYSVLSTSVSRGGILAMNMNLFHQSGFNSSNRIRFSAICRFHRLLSEDYVPFREECTYNTHQIDKVLSKFGTDPEEERVFYTLG